LRGLGKNLEALRWFSRGGAETFVDAGWERELSEGVEEMGEINERGSVEFGVRGDVAALVGVSSWLPAGSVHG
jgi:hypothetical protein